LSNLSRFLFLSPDTGDVDLSNPLFNVYYDSDNCSGKSYVDNGVRYQILKVESKYLIADNSAKVCTNDINITIKSMSTPRFTETGLVVRDCWAFDTTGCIPVVPANEVALPFKTPVGLPVYFK